jgi:hypothetical protein
MAKKKLTTSKIALIQQRRAAGGTFEDLARDFKLSVGTIANALNRRVVVPSDAKPAPKPAAGKDASGAELPTPEDLRRDLAGQIRSIRAELESAESPQLRASLNRVLVNVQQLLSRITPPDPTVAPPGMVLVCVDEMRKLGERGRERFEKLIAGTLEELQRTWPKCAACGTPIAPGE